MKIYIQGWASFDEWRKAGYPGAKSFPPERKPDLRAGLCTHEGCDNVLGAVGSSWAEKLCQKHYYWRRSA